jgi:ATPase subunit of ABC transporter with duplicated ATPase domains
VSHPPALVVLDGVSLTTARQRLIASATLTVPRRRRVALVGRNGSGKTSLLDVIAARCAGEPAPAHVRVDGRLDVAAGVRCGYLRQHATPGEHRGTVAGYLDARAGELGRLHRRHDELQERRDHSAALAEVIERITVLDGWSYPSRRDGILAGIGLGAGDLLRPMATLSGGEATRVALAALLLDDPDLLLLDEPTNNLDAAARTALQDHLLASRAAVLLVSHDRVLLDAVAEEIVEIDEETCGTHVYGGNHSFYRARKDEEFAARMRDYEEQVARRDALLASAGALSGAAQRFQGRSQNDYFRARGRKVARRATVQLARVERQLGDLAEPQPPRRPRIEVPDVPGDSSLLLRADGLAVGHGSPLLSGIDLTIRGGERVVVTGPNGAGKSTLLRVLAGAAPLAGTVQYGPTCRIARLEQSVSAPRSDRSVIEHARRLVPVSEARGRELIGKVVFADIGDIALDRLSAGERRRIELVLLFASEPTLLLLDEPTNHLDLLTIAMLEEALSAYRGAIIAVSHDGAFVEALRPQRRWAVGTGRVDEVAIDRS